MGSEKWAEGAEFHYFADIEDAFLAAVGGKTDISVVPVENSIRRFRRVTLDLLLENETVIIGEIVVKIEHLLSKGEPEKIRVILSHPRACPVQAFPEETFS